MAIPPRNTASSLIFSVCAWISPAIPMAHAADTPITCPGPGMLAGGGGYRMTQDIHCSNGLRWLSDNKFLDLGGFILTAAGTVPANHITLRNGTLYTPGLFWLGSGGTLAKLTVVAQYPGTTSFLIETADRFSANQCSFINAPGVALDFYFGQGGTVRNSTFIGNRYAISLQKGGETLGVTLQNNLFIGNTFGINLYNENSAGVNNNRISANTFQGNDIGINVRAKPEAGPPHPSMRGNRFLDNQFVANRHAGIYINIACDPNLPANAPCPGQNSLVGGNRFYGNGYISAPDYPDIDDGVTAMASRGHTFPYPSGLSGWKFAYNTANMNADLGLEVDGVVDGGGNSAKLNLDSAQCSGVDCGPGTGLLDARAMDAAGLAAPPGQLQFEHGVRPAQP